MKSLTIGLLLIAAVASGLTKLVGADRQLASKNGFGNVFTENRIVVSGRESNKMSSIKLSDLNRPIRVSGTFIKEVESAVKGLYNIENKVVGIKLGNKKRQFLNLTNHVGMKGWETKATGMLSKKQGSTFDLNYRYSVEDMIMNGNSHRLMFITKF